MNDGVSRAAEYGVTFLIVVHTFLRGVHASHQLDDQLQLVAKEVDDESSHDMLAAKLETEQATVPQHCPRAGFGGCLVVPKCSC